jgi:hypothetical protein
MSIEQGTHNLPFHVVSADRQVFHKGFKTQAQAHADCDLRNHRAAKLGTTRYEVIPRPKSKPTTK